jgi:hypothetical protein
MAMANQPAMIMRKLHVLPLLLSVLMPASCSSVLSDDSTSFLEDAGFLEKHAGGELLLSGTGAFVHCPSLQGRVMTSTLDLSEPGLGFVNFEEIETPPTDSPFANYGGEDRLWIGPEGSKFSFFFEPGSEMNREVWRVPAGLNEGAFRQTSTPGELERRISLQNMTGTLFEMDVARSIEVPDKDEIEELLGELPPSALWTAFRTVNRVKNIGDKPWTKDGGLPCVWTLGMFSPGENCLAILPFRADNPDPDKGPAVRSDYFGVLDETRFRILDGFALFRTDAEFVSKVGILRNRAKNVMAAYDPDTRVLTIVNFSAIEDEAPYVNERWVTDVDPFYGDVVNSYNHGGPEAFFELESSSPALELDPGESFSHTSTTMHFRFETDLELTAAVKKALGLDWEDVQKAWF